MRFEKARQLLAAVFALGFVAPFTLYAIWQFAKWLVISTVRSIVDGLHRKLFPERKQQPQQPRHDQHPQPRPQPHNPNPNKHNGQGQPNQGRPPHWQQPQPQTHGPTLNA